ncbi:MAG TPA: hypothetical protein VG347_10990, partial [Verrucomicrobiae bacterium]|nr:hypothetical protein [Verrucomicrobiae bacterium]
VVLTNTAFVYNITLTNFTGFVQANIFVTNTFSSDVTLVGTANSAGTNDIEGASVVFFVQALSNNAAAIMSVTNFTSSPGFLTNTIVTGIFGATNLTNILIVQVASSLSDLGVQIIPPLQPLITNDLTFYDVIVTNFGPGSAPGVMLTNTLPPGVILKSASQGFSLSGSNLIFSLGTVVSNGSSDVRIYFQPTNVMNLIPIATVGASGLVDPNLTNNATVIGINVSAYAAGLLTAVTNSPETNNLQNGLLEQTVLLSNTGTTNVVAARLVVTGLTNQLLNAVGTNGASPFVYLSAPLAVGQSVTLVLQYPRKSFPFTNGQLHAFPVFQAPAWTPARVASISTNVNISRIVKINGGWNNGRVLLEFTNIVGRTYTVVYADDASFSNAMIAPPVVSSDANRVQWLDYGPPATKSAPANSTSRMYRVYQNP